MVDTVRTQQDLLARFADGQGAGAITPQDMRDLIISTVGQTGWADYQDTAYSEASPQSLTANTNNVLEINGAVAQNQEVPVGVSSLWDSVENKILPVNAGSSLLVTLEFEIARASGTGRWEFESFFDIGLVDGESNPVKLYPRSIAVDNGSDFKTQTFSTGMYCLDTFVANGGKVIINPEINAQVYKARIVVNVLSRGRGTYGV